MAIRLGIVRNRSFTGGGIHSCRSPKRSHDFIDDPEKSWFVVAADDNLGMPEPEDILTELFHHKPVGV